MEVHVVDVEVVADERVCVYSLLEGICQSSHVFTRVFGIEADVETVKRYRLLGFKPSAMKPLIFEGEDLDFVVLAVLVRYALQRVKDAFLVILAANPIFV